MLRLPKAWLRSIRSLAAVGWLWFAGLAPAATFTVTNTNDSGAGSLRAAITSANTAGSGTHSINFSATARGTINLASPLPVLSNNMNINGPGSTFLTVSGAGTTRVFFADTGTIQISGLSIASGQANGGTGGDSLLLGGGGGGGGGMGAGGGLYVNNLATVTISGVSFQNNRAVGGNGGATTFNGLNGAGGGGLNGAGGTVINGFGAAGGGGLYGAGGNQTDSSGAGGGGQVTNGGTDGATTGGGGGGITTAGQDGNAGGAGGTGPTGVIGGQGGVLAGNGGAGSANGGGGGGGFLGAGGDGGRNGGGGGAGFGNGGNGGDHGGGGGGWFGLGGNGGFGGGGGGGDTGGTGGFGGGKGGSALTGEGGGGGSGFGGAIFVREGGTLNIIDGDLPTGNSVGAGSGGSGTSNGANGTSAGGSIYLNNSNLSFLVNTSRTVTVGDDIAGVGGIFKNGNGTLTLNGNNSYTGDTTVDAGRLNVNGSITGAVFVNQNGILGGSGSVGPASVNGTVAPGNSIGTLTVNGNYTQGAGSIYQVEVNGAGQSDLIQVNGTATINGGTIVVVPAAGTYTGGTRYVIIRATRGVTGTFSGLTVTPGITNREFRELYSDNEVFLAVLYTRDEFVSVPRTFNQRSVAFSLADSVLPASLTNLYNGLRALTPTELGIALDQLAGAIHGTTLSYSRIAALQTNLLLNDQMHAGLYRCGSDEFAPGYSSWFQTRGGLGQVNGDGNVTSYDYGGGGFLTGIDRWLSESSRVGLYGGYNYWRLNPEGMGDSAIVNAYEIGVSGSQTFDSAYILGNAGYGYNNNYVKRQINFLGFEGYPSTTYGTNLFNVGGETGFAWGSGGFSISPLVGLQYQYLCANQFSENGDSAANLAGDSQTAMALWGSLGSRFAYCVDFYGLFLHAKAQARWVHDYLGDDRSSLMRFEAGAAPFQIQGARTGQDFFWGSLGFAVGADVVRFTFDYSVLASAQQVTHIGNLGFQLQW